MRSVVNVMVLSKTMLVYKPEAEPSTSMVAMRLASPVSGVKISQLRFLKAHRIHCIKKYMMLRPTAAPKNIFYLQPLLCPHDDCS